MYNKSAESDMRPKTPFVPDGTAALRSLSLEDVVFVNVEGVPELSDCSNLTPELQKYWDEFSAPTRGENVSASEAYLSAGNVAEFGKTVCITAGVIRQSDKDGQPYFITTSYAGDDEREVLTGFASMLNNFFSDRANVHYLCGHSIWQKDVPFLAKRLLINGIALPSLFDPKGRRPLRAQLIDTAEFWTFSDHNAPRVPANLLASVFGLDAESADFDPAEAYRLFYEDGDIELIKERSERKALLFAQLMLRFRGEGVIEQANVVRKG